MLGSVAFHAFTDFVSKTDRWRHAVVVFGVPFAIACSFFFASVHPRYRIEFDDANQYDISYEKYFTESDGNFVFALFYKDIKSAGIVTQTISEYDFASNGLIIPDEYIDPLSGVPLEIRNGNFETAFNDDKGGYIKGLEMTYTQIFSFLPGFWSGLGLSTSYSHTKSEIQQISTLGQQDLPISLPGLSENVFQSTLFVVHRDSCRVR